MHIQYTTFLLGDTYFGVNVLRVQEVLVAQQMTPIPCASASVLGLLNLRGQIVTAVSLRTIMGMTMTHDQEFMNLVIRTAEGPVSLLVDAVEDIITVDESSLEPVPDNVAQPTRSFLSGVHQLDGRLLAVLDVDSLFQQEAKAS